MDIDERRALHSFNKIVISDDLHQQLTKCLARLTFWNANVNVGGSHVTLGPFRQADVDTADGTVPVYSLRRTLVNYPMRRKIMYEVIHIEVDATTNEPIVKCHDV